MKLSQLEYFCAVAKLEHATEAARALNITQPALSSAIQRMEEELSVALFERNGRNIKLTQEGELVYQAAQEIMETWGKMEAALQKAANESRNTVRMICSTHILSPMLMAQILAQMPDVSIRVLSPLNKDAFRSFDKKELDLIVNHPMYEGENIANVVLEPDEMVVISSAKSRLAREQSGDIRLAELADYKFASYPEGTSLRVEFEGFCLERGFRPEIVFGANTVKEMLPLVIASDVVAFVPLRTLDDIHENELKVWHVADIAQMPALGMSWRTDKPMKKAVSVVRSCILQYFNISDPVC